KGMNYFMYTNYDELLNINTENTGKNTQQSPDYNQYEATPYPTIHLLFKNFLIKSTDRLVDFGSGKGRLLFYIHYYFRAPVIGVEMNKLLYCQSLNNKSNYLSTL